MLKNSQEVYYLCDSSKIGKVGFLKLSEFDKIDCFITDATLDEALSEALAKAHCAVETIRGDEKPADNSAGVL